MRPVDRRTPARNADTIGKASEKLLKMTLEVVGEHTENSVEGKMGYPAELGIS